MPHGPSAGAAVAAIGLAPDLRKRVEALAEQVARQGVEFEHTLKLTHVESSEFAFLHGGEGAEYYTLLLEAHHSASQPFQVGDLLQKWREPQVAVLTPEFDRQLGDVIASLELLASRDAVRNGRSWIEANCVMIHAIAGNIMKRLALLPKFSHRLHVLFLLHDVLLMEASKPDGMRMLTMALRPYLVWMLRAAFQAASGAEDEDKVLKLLSLWAERNTFQGREAEEVRFLVTTKKDLKQMQLRVVAAPPSANSYLGLPPQICPVPAWMRGASVLPPPAQLQSGLQFSTCGTVPLLASPFCTGQLVAGSGQTTQIGGQTPETVPVGLMSSMLKQVSQRSRDMHTAFVPYKPLDPAFTPQTLPPTQTPSEILLRRLQAYYELVGEAARAPPIRSSMTTMRAVDVTNVGQDDTGIQRNRSRSRSGGKEDARPTTGATDAAAAASTATPLAGSAISAGNVATPLEQVD